MFTRFASILQQAVDALAPDWPLKQEFIAHWKAVTNFFVDKKDYKISVDQTPLPGHISRLLDILLEEEVEQEASDGAIGPCMEYMLQHRILETLYTFARTDCPPGMKQVVLQTFTRLLSRISQPTLPHIHVYRPVQRLVRLCGEVRASPAENDEVQFLCTLCAKIKADPYLVNFFLESPKEKTESRTPDTSPRQQQQHDISADTSSPPPRTCHFTIVDSLLNLVRSEDARVSVKACEGLMLVASLPDDNCAKHIVNDTKFAEHLTTQLCSLYSGLPKILDPNDIESVDAKWGLDVFTSSDDRQNFAGKRHLVSFISWMDFCDQLISVSHPIVGRCLAALIRRRLLEELFEPAILQTSEQAAITATAHLCRCLRLVSSAHLLSEFVYFILGDDTDTEMEQTACSHRLRRRIIERCDHISDELCITTWKLLETLLCKPHRHVVHNLVLRNVCSRSYVDRSSPSAAGGGLHWGSVNSVHSTGANTAAAAAETVGTDEVTSHDKSLPLQSSDNCISNGSRVQTPSREQFTNHILASGDNEFIGQGTTFVMTENGSSSPLKLNVSVDSAISNCVDDNGSPESLDNAAPRNTNSRHSAPTSPVGRYSADDSPASHSVPCSPSKTSSAATQCEPASIQQIVYSWLHLMPDEAKTSVHGGESGYDMYLHDAQQQYASMSSWATDLGWPLSITQCAVSSVDRTQNEVFYEGSFLHVLMNKLSRLLHQSYEVNLQVTSVLSCLAILPHGCLNEYLLNPHVPLKSGVRHLYGVLQKVSTDIESQLRLVPDLPLRLLTMRRQLVGSAGSLTRRLPVAVGTAFCSSDVTLLAGIIVFEEFCKELAAVAFVKHYANDTS